MLKQILGRLPRKPSKSESRRASASAVFPANNNGVGVSVGAYEALASFRDVPASERQRLLVSKLSLCCVLFDFRDASKNAREKEIKRQTLAELVDYITTASLAKLFTEEAVLEQITRMVSVNLFRAPQPSAHDTTDSMTMMMDLEEEEAVMEESWPHLQYVYEFLLRFVASPDTDSKVVKRFIDHSFILRLLELFD